MTKIAALFSVFIFSGMLTLQSQPCDCKKEFLSLQNKMEESYAGFADKLLVISKPVYTKKTAELLKLSGSVSAKEKCLLIISTYLGMFKDDHVYVEFSPAINSITIDSGIMSNKEMISLSPDKIAELRSSRGIEGIYYFRHDSSYKVAVIKSPTAIRDYVAVMLESTYSQWKKGMVKFEAKKESDNVLNGVLYVRSHLARIERFSIDKNSIGNDWQREGTQREGTAAAAPYVPVASRSLSPKTFYIKIASFSAGNAKNIDSLFKANKAVLDTTPNLILDLRNNGGGADFAYAPIIPYIYTNPITTIGLDALSTELNIETWKKILDMKDLPGETINVIKERIGKMEKNKGKWVDVAEDETDSSYTVSAYPKQVIILINKGCASTTEQFLLAALQSKKVTLAGDHTGGVLDYANVRETNFECLPYILNYASTRSRRVDIKQGIDNVGIKPSVYFKGGDWIAEALKILEP